MVKIKKYLFIISGICFLISVMCNSANAVNQASVKSLSIGTTQYGAGYIYGQIQSDTKPEITFKSIDGTIKKDVYIEAKENNTYYFDRHLVGVDFSKSYIFEVKSQNQTYTLNLGNNRTIGVYGSYKVVTKNNEITVSKNTYNGVPNPELKSINLGNTAYGAKYVYGTIKYSETVGTTQQESKANPKIVFKSTDGKIEKEVYVEKRGTDTYYFDRHLVGLDMSKQYVFEVKTGNELNTSKEAVNIVLGSKDLGLNTNNYEIYTKSDKLLFVLETYEGIPKITLNEINLGTASSEDKYVYGKFTYKEEVNGELKSSNKSPKIVFKSTDGKVEKEVYLNKISQDTYYFDRHLLGIDLSKEYVFEVSSGDSRNVSKTTANINLGARNLGIYNKYKVLTTDKKLYFEEDVYNGEPKVQLQSINLGKTQSGGTYIYGKIKYTEIVNGKEVNSLGKPIAVFKSTDGKIEKEVYIDKISENIYYFDRHLDGLDRSKQYTFYIKSSDERNKNKDYTSIVLGNKQLGLFGTYNVKIEGNIVKFTVNKEQYKGIDVSSWQNEINWSKVKASGIDFAFIRVGYRGYTQGNIIMDSMFEKNIVGAKNNNINCGVYFASQAISIEEAIAEAKFTIQNIAKYNITGPVVIDTELAGDGGRANNLSVELRTQIVQAFCQTVQNSGYIPMIYANKYWLKQNLDMSKLGYYDVWLAHYTYSPDIKSDYDGNYTIWQYTCLGIVDGISTPVDMNIAYKDY